MTHVRIVRALNPLQEGGDFVGDMLRVIEATRADAARHGWRSRFTEEQRGTPFLGVDVEPLDARGVVHVDGLHISVEFGDPDEPVFDRWYGTANVLEEATDLVLDAVDGAIPPHLAPAPDHADLVATGLAWSLADDPGETRVTIRRATPWSGASIAVGRMPETLPSAFLGAPDRHLPLWDLHRPADTAQVEALRALKHGSVIHAHTKRISLRPETIEVRTIDHDPVARMRALAAWAEFRDSVR
jgi:hypothetical protein